MKKAFKLAEQITTLYEEADVLADTINAEEQMLELEETDNAELLSPFSSEFEPLRKLWTFAQEYTGATRDWFGKPLAEVNGEEAERTAGDLLSGVAIGTSSSTIIISS